MVLAAALTAFGADLELISVHQIRGGRLSLDTRQEVHAPAGAPGRVELDVVVRVPPSERGSAFVIKASTDSLDVDVSIDGRWLGPWSTEIGRLSAGQQGSFRIRLERTRANRARVPLQLVAVSEAKLTTDRPISNPRPIRGRSTIKPAQRILR